MSVSRSPLLAPHSKYRLRIPYLVGLAQVSLNDACGWNLGGHMHIGQRKPAECQPAKSMAGHHPAREGKRGWLVKPGQERSRSALVHLLAVALPVDSPR